ncbi:LacI family DNA-binding transcriptional regulator [Teichococcus aestuarii]|uniref:LacI family DNA-binding transcriptional regulator n=1 Tax=Teichococcus aestuarii TaxID=568898 RepID=UPI00360A3680
MPPSRTHRITIKDLARGLGMSVATVARAFHPGGAIAAETRALVLRRAEELGYHPNALARGMITRRTRIVGVVVSDLANPFYPAALERLTSRLQGAGYNTMLVMTEPEGAAAASEAAALRLLLSYQPECAIVLATTLSSAASRACREAGTPLLFLNRHPSDPEAAAIVCDNAQGGAALADHLIDRGATRLAFVGGRADASTHAERRAGFLGRCAERGLPPPLEWPGEGVAGAFTYAAGQAAAQALLAGPDRPQAVFCASDILAIGFQEAARGRFGLRVPRDLAIAGFDDIPMAAWPAHDLTTLRQPVEAMLDTALDWIGRLGRGEPLPRPLLRLPGTLVARGSTPALVPATLRDTHPEKETSCSMS